LKRTKSAFPILAVAALAFAPIPEKSAKRVKRITMREEGRPSWAGGPKGLDLIPGDGP
jgi:hypothetical protein